MDNVTLAWIVGSIVVGLIVTGAGVVGTGLLGFGLWILKDYIKHRATPITGVVGEKNCEQCKGDTIARIADLATARREDREEVTRRLQDNSDQHGRLFACLSGIEKEVAYVAGRLRNGTTPTRRAGNGFPDDEERHL